MDLFPWYLLITYYHKDIFIRSKTVNSLTLFLPERQVLLALPQLSCQSVENGLLLHVSQGTTLLCKLFRFQHS